MHFARFLPFLAILAACAAPVPVGPVDPVRPVPVDPVTPPKPRPPGAVATAENVAKVVVGMSFANVQTALAVPAAHDNVNDDGTRLVEYPAVNDVGSPVYLVVHLRGDVVIGRVRVPRAP